MCDMQKMPARGDTSCEEDSDMNFAAFSAVGAGGTHFVTTGGQLPVTKLQQNPTNNGTMVGMAMGDGTVQYMRALESGATLQATPQLITVPIALPGAKPGDPQQTVQIQVLNPNMLQQQQQPKYHMQIPIQGLQQGGAILTVAYSPDGNDTGGIQLVGQNSLTDGLQMLAGVPHDMQLVQPTHAHAHANAHDSKEHVHTNMHQVFITPNQQIIINSPDDNKALNNNTSTNNNNALTEIVIKDECEDYGNDDESSQDCKVSESISQQINDGQQKLVKYFSQLPPQEAQVLPLSLRQFLKLNPTDMKRHDTFNVELMAMDQDRKEEAVAEAILGEDGTLRIQSKKKKKYKKKPPKPVRPKPGQVVIATASDGTPIFCCPECQMAYPEKEQLEIHLITHKIERRYICGICGAGLKRKEHLERHKLGHNPERPYVCDVCCKGFKRREHLNLHAVIHSGVKTEMCLECGKGFYRKDHLRKHTRSHESKRLRDEASAADMGAPADSEPATCPAACPSPCGETILPEITIHVPTGANVQVPVQINIPEHVVSSLAAAQQAHKQQLQRVTQQQQQPESQQHASDEQQQQQQRAASDAHAQLEALLAHHT